MSKQYCFSINNPSNNEFDVEKLKTFVEKLYIGDGKFGEDESLPFVVIYAKTDNNVCILMTSRAKKNVERIEKIHSGLTKKDLKWVKGITLSTPYEFDLEAATWWKQEDKANDGRKWTSIVQRGPYFVDIMEPYIPLGASLTYEGKKYKLTPAEEKIASFYAKRLISEAAGGVVDEWTKDKVFNNNFWKDFKTYLTPEHKAVFKDFSKIKWTDVVSKIEAEKAKDMKSVDKIRKKIKTEEKKREYGFAVLDGVKEKVGNFTVEPQAIFYGRGANPNRGRVKRQILPEDVTINIGKNDPVPTPPPGHSWGNIIHDHTVVWIAKWNDSISNDPKYVMFSVEGRFKGESDLTKYEKARKLERHIEDVRKKYMNDADSNNSIQMQLGTVLYLIDHFGVRVGNERKEDEADTVGASTLRVNHVKLKKPNKVIFDFLGKDSIRFYKELEVPKVIFDNFEKLTKGKNGDDQLFNLISSKSINAYLKEFDKNFSAKVFRTRLASKIMFNALKSVKIPEGATKAQIKLLFNKANAKVADVLNHTRNVSKKAKESVKKFEDLLAELKKELKEKKKEGKSTAAIEKRIDATKNKIEAKADVMTVAINTSLTNYIDPRMIVSWAKSQDTDITAVYSSTLMRKFQWAVDTTSPKWNWEKSPLTGNDELDPVEEGKAVHISSSQKRSTRRRSVSRAKLSKSKPTKTTKTTKPSDDDEEDSDDMPLIPTKSSKQPRVTKVTKVTKVTQIEPEELEEEEDESSQMTQLTKLPESSESDYKLLLEICLDPIKNRKNFSKVSKEAMSWIYPFSKYAIDKKIPVKANEYIVKFYDLAYKK